MKPRAAIKTYIIRDEIPEGLLDIHTLTRNIYTILKNIKAIKINKSNRVFFQLETRFNKGILF